MRQFWMSLTLAVVVLVGLWALLHRDQIENVSDAVDLAKQQLSEIVPKNGFKSASSSRILPNNGSVRIATFNIHKLDRQKMANRRTAELLAKTIREFDLIALQGLESGNELMLRQLMELVNSEGNRFDFVISPTSPTDRSFIYAFVVNTETIHLDGAHRYLLQDPDNLMTHPPFIGWFRTVTPDPDRSFTFSLVNVCLDRQRNPGEIQRIGEIFRVVRNDGRGEDDVIVVGDFDANNADLDFLDGEFGLISTIQNTPTTTHGDQQRDNILVETRATSEFTGRVGVFDLMNVFNLKSAEAIAISEQMPSWAEFSKFEGDAPRFGLPQKTANSTSNVLPIK